MYKILLFFLVVYYAITNAQWIQTNAPKGVPITCLAVSDTNIYAGTWKGDIYLSTNNGNSWKSVNNGLTNTNITSLAVIGKVIFAGTYNGVYCSTNNGACWTAVSVNNDINPYPTLVNTFVTCPIDTGGTYLFAGGNSVNVSSNYGKSWGIIDNMLDAQTTNALAVNGQNLFVGTAYSGIYHFNTFGRGWDFVKHVLTDKYVYSLAIKGMNLCCN